MDFDAIIARILWGKSLSNIEDGFGNSHLFILRSLTSREANIAEYIYEKEYNKAINSGILKQKDLEDLYKEIGVWTNEDDIMLVGYNKKISLLRTKVKDLEFLPNRKRQVERELKKTRQALSDLQNKKNSLFYSSAESRAEEIKRRYIVMLSTEDEFENKYWQKEEDFLKCNDHVLVYNLAMAYYKNNIYETKILRKLARNPAWRYRWQASKNGADLFGKPISEWSEMQNMIVYWSQFYDSIYEHPERPSDFIIENDDACDSWIEEQSRSTNKNDNKKNVFGTKKATTQKEHQEQFIMVERGDKETVKRIQEENPSSVRERLRREYDKIKNTKGRIKEWDLRKKR